VVQSAPECGLTDIHDWLSRRKLRLIPSKTQAMWLGSGQQLDKIDIRAVSIMSTRVSVEHTVRYLGVIFDSRLTMADHVVAVCRSGCYQFRQLRPVIHYLSADGAKAVVPVHAFISCRLDYCNSLLTGVADCLLRRLQSLQNAAARLVTGAPRREHSSPILRQLHWLPVRQRVRYKLATLAFRSLSGQVPAYLTDDFQLVAASGRRTLRSAE